MNISNSEAPPSMDLPKMCGGGLGGFYLSLTVAYIHHNHLETRGKSINIRSEGGESRPRRENDKSRHIADFGL